jgi:hypothetical protein
MANDLDRTRDHCWSWYSLRNCKITSCCAYCDRHVNMTTASGSRQSFCALQVSRTILDASGESELPWSEQWPLIKRAFDQETTHTTGVSSLRFFWKGLSVLLWIRYPYTIMEWAIRKTTAHLLETRINHKGQGKQTLSPTAIQRISLLVSDTVMSALLNPVIAVRNRLVLQPAGYNYCFGALSLLSIRSKNVRRANLVS